MACGSFVEMPGKTVSPSLEENFPLVVVDSASLCAIKVLVLVPNAAGMNNPNNIESQVDSFEPKTQLSATFEQHLLPLERDQRSAHNQNQDSTAIAKVHSSERPLISVNIQASSRLNRSIRGLLGYVVSHATKKASKDSSK
jgi:hypothetical protein